MYIISSLIYFYFYLLVKHAFTDLYSAHVYAVYACYSVVVAYSPRVLSVVGVCV
jgi:hypothetical protein